MPTPKLERFTVAVLSALLAGQSTTTVAATSASPPPKAAPSLASGPHAAGSSYDKPTFYDDFKHLSVIEFDGSHWPPLPSPNNWALTGYFGWPANNGADHRNGDGARFLSNNKEVQSYEDAAVTIGPHGLRLAATRTSRLSDQERAAMHYPAQQWRSGMVAQNPAKGITYGYFEWVVKLPAGDGLWPALWLASSDLKWPPEIDALEMLGKQPTVIYCTPHSGEPKAAARVISQREAVGDTTSAFHKMGVLWKPDFITWFWDDTQIDRQETPPDANKPMYIIANLAVGGPGSWPGPTSTSTPSPALMEVKRIQSFALGSWGSATIPRTAPAAD